MNKDLQTLINEAEAELDRLYHFHKRLLDKEQKIHQRLQELKKQLHEDHDESLLTVTEASRLTGLSRRTMYNYLNKGKIHRIDGMIPKSEIKPYINGKDGSTSFVHTLSYSSNFSSYQQHYFRVKEVEFIL